MYIGFGEGESGKEIVDQSQVLKKRKDYLILKIPTCFYLLTIYSLPCL
jgi:hypothetical protein